MYTIEEIEEKIRLAKTAKLSGAELLEDRERVARVCNGIGAWWMSDRLRRLISWRFPDMVIVADIHDLRHETGGRWWMRWVYDFEFLTNGLLMSLFRRRAKVALQALRLWLFLVAGSWTAFHYRK